MEFRDKPLSYEYIRGLVDGEGCFSFCSYGYAKEGKKRKLPTFTLAMSKRDEELIRKVRTTLGLTSSVYSYPPRSRPDGYKRQGMAMLLVRRFGEIKNVIVPLFYKKLHGYKAKQFSEWIEKMEKDPGVPQIYKLIPKLCRSGFYDRNYNIYS